MSYVVYADDNFHHMDESERVKIGEFDTEVESLEKCKEVVDKYLVEYAPKFQTADELYDSYTSYGDDPFIIGPTKVEFSAWEYAKEQCKKLYEDNQ